MDLIIENLKNQLDFSQYTNKSLIDETFKRLQAQKTVKKLLD